MFFEHFAFCSSFNSSLVDKNVTLDYYFGVYAKDYVMRSQYAQSSYRWIENNILRTHGSVNPSSMIMLCQTPSDFIEMWIVTFNG